MIRKSEKKGHKPTDDNQLRPLMTVKAGGSHKASRKQGQVDKSTCQCTNLIKIGPLFPFLFFRQQEHYYRSAYALFHFGIRPESIFLWVCHNGTLIPCDLLVFNQFKQKRWWKEVLESRRVMQMAKGHRRCARQPSGNCPTGGNPSICTLSKTSRTLRGITEPRKKKEANDLQLQSDQVSPHFSAQNVDFVKSKEKFLKIPCPENELFFF